MIQRMRCITWCGFVEMVLGHEEAEPLVVDLRGKLIIYRKEELPLKICTVLRESPPTILALPEHVINTRTLLLNRR